MSSSHPATFLSLPAELRNEIYLLLFTPCATTTSLPAEESSPLHKALGLDSSSFHRHSKPPPTRRNDPSTHLAPLLTCRQFHTEAHLLALSLTPFHLASPSAQPDTFCTLSSSLDSAQLGALKHLTLTARVGHLRALNETWQGLPFGHSSLRLETLTIVPRRADATNTAYAEVADLSQSHTLAYIFAETLKGLKGVREVRVVNDGCFNETVWGLLYRSLVYRMWRWGGIECGVRFAHSDGMSFRALLGDGQREGREVGEEVCRLIGVAGREPSLGLGT